MELLIPAPDSRSLMKTIQVMVAQDYMVDAGTDPQAYGGIPGIGPEK